MASRLYHFRGCCWVFGLFSLKCNKQKWFLCETFSDNVWKRLKTYLMFYVRTQAVRWKYKYVGAKIIARAHSCRRNTRKVCLWFGKCENEEMRVRESGRESGWVPKCKYSNDEEHWVGLTEDIRSQMYYIYRCTQLLRTCTFGYTIGGMCILRVNGREQRNKWTFKACCENNVLKLQRHKEKQKAPKQKTAIARAIPNLAKRENE